MNDTMDPTDHSIVSSTLPLLLLLLTALTTLPLAHRGYKAGLLTQGHYSNLTQCETLDGALAHEVTLHVH